MFDRFLHWWRVSATLLFVSVTACSALALDTKKPLAEFMHQTWTVDNGLPHSTIRSISQTKDGYLWFATHEGVARFDGVTFAIFDEANTPVLRGSGVAALLAQADGGLLLGLRDGGLVRFHLGKFAPVTPKGGLPPGSISLLAEDATGALWVGTTSSGVARIVNGESRIYSAQDGLPGDWVTAVRPTQNGDIWIGTMLGVVIFRDGKIVKQPTNSWLDTTNIAAILEDDKKRLWFATSGEGLAMRSGDSIRRYRRANGLASDNLVSLHRDRDGAIWIGTLEGIQRLAGEQFEGFASADGLTNNYIREIFEDADGSVWVGTDRGIDRFRDSLISNWGLRQGLTEEFTRVALEDKKGRIWVGTSDGLFAITSATVRRYGRENGLLSGAILALAEDANGVLWVGTNGGGLHRMQGERFELVSPQLSLSTASVRAILPTSDGSLWIGTNNGLVSWRWRGDAPPNRFGVADGLPSEQINALFEDAQGRVWIGGRGGLAVLEKATPSQINAIRKVPGSTATVLGINTDTEGRIWVSTVSGLALLGSDKSAASLKWFSRSEGINAQTYFSAIDDGLGSLWLCSNRGIVKLPKSHLDELLSGKRTTVESALLGRAEGMKTVQCNGSSQPAGWRTRNGRLLFPTALGLAVAEPARKVTGNPLAPSVHIKSVLVDAVAATPNLSGVLVVPAGQHRLEISYVGLNLVDPDKVRYRYQLMGFDNDWVDAGRESKAVYTNVASGSYEFRVVAARDGGIWGGIGATLAIEKQQRLHETVWFRVGFAVALILLVFVIYRGRVTQLNMQRQRLQEMIDERTRDLEAEKQKLASINKEKAHLLLQVANAAKEYERLSKEDSLTGLSNRRELDRILSHEFERAVRNGRPLSIALADIDFFKKINDMHSHAVGDEVLRVIAQILKEGCRGIDMVGRYGGEEFVLVLPEADQEVARQICERLRIAIEQFDWPSKQAGPSVTMSFGLATLATETSFERLVALADARLYEAKEGGRNRVCAG